MANAIARILNSTQSGLPRRRNGSTSAFCMYHMGPPRTSVRARAAGFSLREAPIPANASLSFRYSGAPSSAPASVRAGALGSGTSRTSRYITASVHSMNFRAMPSRPTTHIQKMAPGPPSETATATPAMLPSPIVADSAAQSAWK